VARLLLAVQRAAHHVAAHCYVCGRLHAAPMPHPQPCGNDLCRFAEVETLRFADLRHELRAHGYMLHLLLAASIAALSQPSERRVDLFDPVPADYCSAGSWRGVACARALLPGLA
jgi:hypothetical protein